jgi:hypothetical protein
MSKSVCVKNIKTGKISRIKKDDAELKVKTGHFSYVPKSEWKESKKSGKDK